MHSKWHPEIQNAVLPILYVKVLGQIYFTVYFIYLLVCLFIHSSLHPYIYLGFMSLSTLYRSYQDGCFVGRGNQYIQLVKVLYCKLPTIGKQLPTFPHRVWDLNPSPYPRGATMATICDSGKYRPKCLYMTWMIIS